MHLKPRLFFIMLDNLIKESDCRKFQISCHFYLVFIYMCIRNWIFNIYIYIL